MINQEFENLCDEETFDKYVERLKNPTKWDTFKFKVMVKWEQFKNWFKSRSLTELLTDITIIGSIIGMGIKGIKMVRSLTKKSGTERLADQRDYSYYDPHTGIRWDLKRKMTNNEKAELRVRMDSGEPAEEILKDLGVYLYK